MRHTFSFLRKFRRSTSEPTSVMALGRNLPRALKPLLHGARTPIFSKPLPLVLKPRFPPSRAAVFCRFYSPETEKSKPTTKACPTCGTAIPLQSISCSNCNSLTPLPNDINYLTLFNISSTLPFNFDIDLAALRREYLRIMSKVHPDSMTGQPEVANL